MKIFREITWFFQRGKRGWADNDVWSFDSYLCDFISKAVRQLSMTVHGCPPELHDSSKTNDECWKWRETLEEIAQGFESGKELIEGKHGRMVKKAVGGQEVYTWEISPPEHFAQLTKKFDRGMELFHQYFFNLWD